MWIFSAGIALASTPFLLLATYILRIATIAKQTLAIGPFVLRESAREESWDAAERPAQGLEQFVATSGNVQCLDCCSINGIAGDEGRVLIRRELEDDCCLAGVDLSRREGLAVLTDDRYLSHIICG